MTEFTAQGWSLASCCQGHLPPNIGVIYTMIKHISILQKLLLKKKHFFIITVL